MTITSVPATTTPGAHAAGKSAADPTTADATALGFLAELAAAITSVGNLAQVTGALPGTVPSASSGKTGTTTAAVAAGGSVLTAIPGLVPGLPGTPTVTGQPAATGAGQAASVLPARSGLPATASAPTSTALPAASPTAPAAAGAVPVVAPAATPAATPAVATVPAARVAATPVATTETVPTTTSTATPVAAPAPATPARSHHAARTETPAATPATPDPAPSTDQSIAAAPVAQAASAAAPVTTDKTRTTAVLQQVFPEISKLATAGNGTHRMTITLHPDDLGTVRVTLSVRDGNVRVTLAADQATSALAAGRPELQRLLEQHGATDTRIVVRDLGAATANPATTTGGDSRQPGQQASYAAGGYAEDAPRGRQERAAVVPNPRTETPDRTSTTPTPSTTRRATSGVDQLI